jgi:hypothetical protein
LLTLFVHHAISFSAAQSPLFFLCSMPTTNVSDARFGTSYNMIFLEEE